MNEEIYFNPKWRANFPKRRKDKSFCVVISMEIKTDNQESMKTKIQKWIDEDWRPRNILWIRTWETGESGKNKYDEYSYYMTEFSTPPQIISCDDGVLKIRLNGQPTDRYWRDWMVFKIIPDLKEKFSEIGEFINVKDCDN